MHFQQWREYVMLTKSPIASKQIRPDAGRFELTPALSTKPNGVSTINGRRFTNNSAALTWPG